MKRNAYKSRDRFYNQSDVLGKIIPIFRRMVVPGQRISHASVRVNFQTVPLSTVQMNSCVASVYSFYVPLRLVWTGWTDFISGVDTTTPIPTSAVAAPWMYDMNNVAVPQSTLYRRAVKLCYNQFFGDQEFDNQGTVVTPPWYNVTADGVVDQYVTKTLENRLASVTETDELTTYSFPTTAGTPPTIELREFSRAMGNARRDFVQDTTGDKYVDLLRSLGVDPDWRVQNAPEFLGVSTMDVYPSYTQSTELASLGVANTKYHGTIRHEFGKKAFAEHGYIVSFFVLRQLLFSSVMGPSDVFRATATREAFWVGSKPDQNFFRADYAFTSGMDFVGPQSWPFVAGGNVSNNNGQPDYLLTMGNGNRSTLVYPSPTLPSTSTELGTDRYAVHADWTVEGLTPTPTRDVF